MSVSYSIRTVSEKTGLSPHVIRAWERRYRAIEPKRTKGKHRIYTDTEVERLQLLHQAVENGHGIGRIANLDNDKLRALTTSASRNTHPSAPPGIGTPFLDEAVRATVEFNLPALEDSLRRASLTLGHQGLLRHVIAPSASTIGEKWRQGEITAAHEHFFTAAVKVLLGELSRPHSPRENAPIMIASTPAGQLHELGALLASAAASNAGWNTIYLGPALPAREIAGAATRNNANAVALSIVYPDDDPRLPRELEDLASLLPQDARLIVGGRASAAYADTLRRIGAIHSPDLGDFDSRLDSLRHHTPA